MKQEKTVWTIASLLNWTRQYFADKGVDNPRLDAEVLLSHILQCDRLYLYVHFDQPLQEAELAAFRDCVKKRAQRVPVAYITGHKEFMGLDFRVTPAVLIPRPDTEILVEAVGQRLAEQPAPRLLDLGTGSGAICISLLCQRPEATAVTVDVSAAALDVAAGNAAALGVADRLELRCGDLWAPVKAEKYTAIVSNPPYITAAEMKELTPEVLQEPHLALTDHGDGLAFYRRIVRQAAAHLEPGGFLALEVGQGQAAAVAALADADSGLACTAIVPDYAGIERVVICTLRA